MKITVRSALTNKILVSLHVQPDDTIERLQHEAALLCGLEKGRHCMQLVLPKQRIRRNRHGKRIRTKNRDVETSTVEQVGWSDESDVLAVIVPEAEISVTLNRDAYTICAHRLHNFEKMHPKFQRIRELSGCSSCVVDHRDLGSGTVWNTVRFNGVPADTDIAKTATEELLSRGYLPMLCKAFSEQICVLHGEDFDSFHSLEPWMMAESWECAFDRWILSIESELDVVITDGWSWRWEYAGFVCGGHSHYMTSRMTIAGEAEAVLAAADVLKQLVTTGCSELTHPGLVSEEYILPALSCHSLCSALTTLLRESHLRHTICNSRVGVQPRLNDQPKIVLVGEPDRVRRAKAYLERQLLILCHDELQRQRLYQRYGTDAVERFGIGGRSDDFWGEDEMEEDWMQPYLYQRS